MNNQKMRDALVTPLKQLTASVEEHGIPDAPVKKAKRDRTPAKTRGVFERVPGSDIWYIRFIDSDGRFRRERAGTKSVATKLYHKRKADALKGIKLPEVLNKRRVSFGELCDDAEKYSKKNNEGFESDCYRIAKLKAEFGNYAAETIPVEHFRNFFDNQEWEAGTRNRARTVLFRIYGLGIENGKVSVNPAAKLKRVKVDDNRVRFLNQYEPLATEVDYLKPITTEEGRLRAVIAKEWPTHLEELEIALQSGMRRKEQYTRLTWERVDLTRKDLHVPPSKNGQDRHISLNATAVAAFEQLIQRRAGDEVGVVPIRMQGRIFIGKGEKPVDGPRHWFDDAVAKAGLADFTWHDLRHTFASRLVMAGVDLVTVAALMGHKKIQMTMRYAHLAPAHKQSAVDKLAAYCS